jgi:hypothetical protein
MADSTKAFDSPDVWLRLTPEEARTVTAIAVRVGGSPFDSPRKHVDAITAALADVGHKWSTSHAEYMALSDGSNLFFENYPKPVPAEPVYAPGDVIRSALGYKYLRTRTGKWVHLTGTGTDSYEHGDSYPTRPLTKLS